MMSRRLPGPVLRFKFVPAILAVLTDIAAGLLVSFMEPDYPLRFVAFQILMLGLALLLAAPYRGLWVRAFALLAVYRGRDSSGISCT